MIYLFLLFVFVSFMQETLTEPIPTKTPTPSTPPTSLTEEPISEDIIMITSPFTQSDLEEVTGDVLRPNAIFWHNNQLYVSCTGDSTLYLIDVESSRTIVHSRGIQNAHTLYVEETDNLSIWIPDYGRNAIVRVNNRSNPQTVIENIESPWGIVYMDENSFLVTSTLEGVVYRITRTGELEPILSGLRSPMGIAILDNYVFVANNSSTRDSIVWFEYSNDNVSNTLVSGLQNVTNLVHHNDGYLYFSYSIGSRGVVGRVYPDDCLNGCTNDQVEIVLYSELNSPLSGLTISPDNTLFIHTIYQNDIYKLQLVE